MHDSNDNVDGYLSVIGSNYFYPLSLIFEKLDEYKISRNNEVQVSADENGYSAVAIVISILMLESYLSKTMSTLLELKKLDEFDGPAYDLFKCYFNNSEIYKKFASYL